MEFSIINPDKSISLFVKNIMIFEEQETNMKTVLPFFADGCPGLMFQETENGLLVSPHNKEMPPLFLYGQTIKPIELVMQGAYKLIAFQLYPFVLQSFFTISANEINDGCFDLGKTENGNAILKKLIIATKTEDRVELITHLLFDIFNRKKESLDLAIAKSIQLIMDNKGQLSIAQLCPQLPLTKRTFERRFIKEVGISPKQFSQIIQFQQSFQQLTLKEFTKLTDIVYANGFADQSHFIRVFKAYTGKTPKKFPVKSA